MELGKKKLPLYADKEIGTKILHPKSKHNTAEKMMSPNLANLH
jgi:hypothetical protein